MRADPWYNQFIKYIDWEKAKTEDKPSITQCSLLPDAPQSAIDAFEAYKKFEDDKKHGRLPKLEGGTSILRKEKENDKGRISSY